MTIEKQLADALRIIAAHAVAAPLTQNDDNVSLSDLPFYVAGKAHAELGILHNIARNALDAYEARSVATDQPRFFIDHGQIHDRVTGKHITTDEDTVFCDGINHCLALLNELAALPSADELQVGDFVMRASPNGIWIGRADGEGGEFATEHVERVIAQFYREQF